MSRYKVKKCQFKPSMRILVASILRAAARSLREAGNIRWEELEKAARLIEKCGIEEYDPLRNDNHRRACRHRLCPACMAQLHSIPKRALIESNFMLVPRQHLWAVRLSLPWGRVLGSELKATKKRLEYSVRRLTQSTTWAGTFLRWAGCFHLEWMKASKKNGAAGFWVHLHLLCESTKRPQAEALVDRFRSILGVGNEVQADDFIDIGKAKSMERYAEYMTDVEHLLPGYTEDKRHQRRMKSMSAEDILHFADATRGMRKVVSHNLDKVKTDAALIDPKTFLGLPKGRSQWGR